MPSTVAELIDSKRFPGTSNYEEKCDGTFESWLNRRSDHIWRFFSGSRGYNRKNLCLWMFSNWNKPLTSHMIWITIYEKFGTILMEIDISSELYRSFTSSRKYSIQYTSYSATMHNDQNFRIIFRLRFFQRRNSLSLSVVFMIITSLICSCYYFL